MQSSSSSRTRPPGRRARRRPTWSPSIRRFRPARCSLSAMRLATDRLADGRHSRRPRRLRQRRRHLHRADESRARRHARRRPRPWFRGAFISKLVIDKTTLEVLSGDDLIQTRSPTTRRPAHDPLTAADRTLLLGRSCGRAAFYNAATGLGYNGGRIFLNGEEIGNEGRAFAHIATGAEAGNSYELAWLGNMSFENVVANPHTGNKTVVALTDDRPRPGLLLRRREEGDRHDA